LGGIASHDSGNDAADVYSPAVKPDWDCDRVPGDFSNDWREATGGLNATFLATTILTCITGFFFPITKVTPGLVIGAISLVVLAVALFALYSKKLAGGWRTAYVVTAVTAQFFNVLVLIAQSFMKIPALHAMARQAKRGL